MKYFVVAALALLAPVAWSQEATAPKTTDQVREGFRAAIEICLDANRRNLRLEDIPESEMAGRLTKMSAITQAGSPEPPCASLLERYRF